MARTNSVPSLSRWRSGKLHLMGVSAPAVPFEPVPWCLCVLWHTITPHRFCRWPRLDKCTKKKKEHQKASCAISMSMASPHPTYRSFKKHTRRTGEIGLPSRPIGRLSPASAAVDGAWVSACALGSQPDQSVIFISLSQFICYGCVVLFFHANRESRATRRAGRRVAAAAVERPLEIGDLVLPEVPNGSGRFCFCLVLVDVVTR